MRESTDKINMILSRTQQAACLQGHDIEGVFKWLLIVLCLFYISGVALAQDATPTEQARPLNVSIQIGQVVSDDITDFAVFDWWFVTLNEGDELVVEMQGQNGLSPLIGLLDPTRELVARSDEVRPPEVNGLAVMQYLAPESATYTIVATREGNTDGDTIGDYTLRTFLAADINAPERMNNRTEIEFRCDAMLVTTAAVIEFLEERRDPDANGIVELYRLTVFGFDDFDPVIRVEQGESRQRLDCSDDAQRVPGSSISLSGEPPYVIESDMLDNAARLTLRNTDTVNSFGQLRFTIGSRDGNSGQYVAVLEGLALSERNAIDAVNIAIGALARPQEALVYMVGENPGRLDPYIGIVNASGEYLQVCDDAGRGDCSDVPVFDMAEAVITVGVCDASDTECSEDNLLIDETRIASDRFDAGIVITSDMAENPLLFELQSRNGETDGAYTLFIIGEIPAEDE